MQPIGVQEWTKVHLAGRVRHRTMRFREWGSFGVVALIDVNHSAEK
jgi:hypothetical protein